MICARSVIRSNNALHNRGFGNTVVHSENGVPLLLATHDDDSTSSEESLHEEAVKISISMNDTDQLDSVLQWEIEEQDFLEAV